MDDATSQPATQGKGLAKSPGALAGLKVIDLTRVLGGPYCTMILSDHGAEVIKIEPPQGDEVRDWGPPFHENDASYYIGINRNKRAIALDIGKPAGRAVLLRLLEGADILIENFKPGSMEKWEIGYDTLAQRFPRLIHCRISGFGADGPLGGLPGYDAILQAMTGLMSVNGDASTGPLRLGTAIVDMGTGLYSAIGILMALHERERSGQGQYLDMTLYDCGMALLHPQAANFFLNGNRPKGTGNPHPNLVPYDKFPTKTCDIFIASGNNGQFRKMAEIIGRPELADDPRFADNGKRNVNRAALTEVLAAAFAEHDGDELSMKLIRGGVPAGPVLPVDQSTAAPHTAHREMVTELDWYRGIGTPIKLRRTPGGTRRPPPKFAQDGAEVLAQHGYTADEIAALQRDGVVLTDTPHVAAEPAKPEAATCQRPRCRAWVSRLRILPVTPVRPPPRRARGRRQVDRTDAVRQLVLDEPAENLQILATRKTRAPQQADTAVRPRRAERSHLEPLVPRGQVRHRHRRQQCAADPGGDHLGDRLQTGCPEVVIRALPAAVLVAADRQRLVAQAVPLVEQQQALVRQLAFRHDRPVAELVPGRTGEAERLLEQRHGAMHAGLLGQRDQQDVQRVGLERVDQVVGQVLPQDQPKLRKALVQFVEQQRQNVGAERRDDAETQHAGERAVAMAHQFRDLVGFLEDAAGVGDDARADRRQGHRAGGALDQRHAKGFLELPQLAAERRLGDAAALRGAAEVPEVGDRDQIAQFGQGHGGLPSFATSIAEIASLDWTNEPIAASLHQGSGRAPGGRMGATGLSAGSGGDGDRRHDREACAGRDVSRMCRA